MVEFYQVINKVIIDNSSSWGNLVIYVNNKKLSLLDKQSGRSDAILFSNVNNINGYRYWNWADDQTKCRSHKINVNSGGIRPETIVNVLNTVRNAMTPNNRNNLILILSSGYHKQLEIDPTTLTKHSNIKVLETSDAIKEYNRLAIQNIPVLGFFHMTC